MVTDGEAFAERLAALEREGGNVLVIADEAMDQPCHPLLGGDGTARLFVTTGRTVTPLESSIESDAFAVGHVSIAADDPPEGDPTSADTETGADDRRHVIDDVTDLSTIAFEVHRQLRRLSERNDDVRVCFDSLDPLVQRTDEQLLFRFLHVLTNRIAAANAVAHYHLGPDVDERLRNLYAPLFDGTLEYRQASDGIRKRWLNDVRTEWILSTGRAIPTPNRTASPRRNRKASIGQEPDRRSL